MSRRLTRLERLCTMDRLAIIKARVAQITKLPLADREAIPHERFMELTKEFLDLIRQWKELDANNNRHALGND